MLEKAQQGARRAHARIDHLGQYIAEPNLALALSEPKHHFEDHVLGHGTSGADEAELEGRLMRAFDVFLDGCRLGGKKS